MKVNGFAKTQLKPDKRFLRFDRPFNDAVRAKSESAIEEVLLRAQLSGDNARRTAEKILADRPPRKVRAAGRSKKGTDQKPVRAKATG
jgi:hypothetical protein